MAVTTHYHSSHKRVPWQSGGHSLWHACQYHSDDLMKSGWAVRLQNGVELIPVSAVWKARGWLGLRAG